MELVKLAWLSVASPQTLFWLVLGGYNVLRLFRRLFAAFGHQILT